MKHKDTFVVYIMPFEKKLRSLKDFSFVKDYEENLIKTKLTIEKKRTTT
jgi:hypothetical protein